MENENDSQQEQQPLLSQTSVPSRSSRLASLDLLRGLVMIFESIDHARALISNIKVKHETWFEMPLYNGNVLHWFIRFITGICAPAFFFLMAIGIVLFNTSRQKIGWSQVRIVKHFATRGVLIVLINFLQFPLLTGKIHCNRHCAICSRNQHIRRISDCFNGILQHQTYYQNLDGKVSLFSGGS